MKYLALFALLISAISTAFAQSNSPYETKVYDTSYSTSSKVVIEKDEIQDSRAPNMTSLLSTKANINITNTPFQPNSLFVRGGDSSQVLILIDGVPVYDASTVQRSFNLNSISLNTVQRITVIKGSQSAWYGGQALSAVIKIDTMPAQLTANQRIDVSAGSSDFRDLNGQATARVSQNAMVLARGQYQFQNSLSPVENSTFRYKKREDSAEAVYLYRDDFQFNVKMSHTSDRNENVTGLSFNDFASADTLNFITSNEVNQFQTAYRDNTVAYKPFLSVGYMDAHRAFTQEVNPYNTMESNQEYKSALFPVRGELRLINDEHWKWDVGASYQKESMLWESFRVQQAQKENEMKGTFTKLEWNPRKALSILAGTRYDTDQNFRDVSTYQVGATYQEFKIEHSTGYRLPSLYQLFSNKGNAGLNPEYARNYAISYDHAINKDVSTSLAVFETHVENLIGARGNPLQYYNVGRTLTRGFEASAYYRIEEGQKLAVNIGYQEPRDVVTGRWLNRRPLKSGSVVYTKKEELTTWTLELVGRGEREDFKNSTDMVRLEGYTSLNTSYIVQLPKSYGDDMSIYFRGENLMSNRYEESYGFRNPGLEIYVGLRAGN